MGIISLLLTRDFDTDTTIVDKQRIMLDYAVRNFSLNGIKVQVFHSDFTQINIDERFDYIVSNPPFYGSDSTQSDDNHINIARYAHHLPVESFIEKSKSLLKPRGWLIFCYDARYIDQLMYHLKNKGINPEQLQFVHSKIDRESKLVMIAARNNSRSQTKILPPMIVFDRNSIYTPEAQKAFDMAATHSIKGDF